MSGGASANARIRAADDATLREAAALLRAGGVVAFPTETVYGLGADAGSAAGVATVYSLKGRPADHPLIVHVLDRAQGGYWAEIGSQAGALIDRFWPGPLTLILRRRAEAPAFACGGEATVGLRCPSHPVARALLLRFAEAGGHGIAAPSANRFGRVSPTRAQHVLDDLGVQAPMIIDGGASDVGVESTIVDLSRGAPVLLRPGRIGRNALQAALGAAIGERDSQAPRVSGTLASHYAPATPLELVDGGQLEQRIAGAAAAGEPVAVWSRARPRAPVAAWQRAAADASDFERALYDTLRTLDRSGVARILIERPPSGDPAWEAALDRLARAAAAADSIDP